MNTTQLPLSSPGMAGREAVDPRAWALKFKAREYIRELAARIDALEGRVAEVGLSSQSNTHTDHVMTDHNGNGISIDMSAGHPEVANEDQVIQHEEHEHEDDQSGDENEVNENEDDENEDSGNEDDEPEDEPEDETGDSEPEDEYDDDDDDDDDFEDGEEPDESSEEEDEPLNEDSLGASDISLLEAFASRRLPTAWFASDVNSPNRQTNEIEGAHNGEPGPSLPRPQVEAGSSSSQNEVTPPMGCYQQEYNAHVMSSRLEYRANGFQQEPISRPLTSTLGSASASTDPASASIAGQSKSTRLEIGSVTPDLSRNSRANQCWVLSPNRKRKYPSSGTTDISLATPEIHGDGIGPKRIPTRSRPSLQNPVCSYSPLPVPGGGSSRSAALSRLRTYRRALRQLRKSTSQLISPDQSDTSAIYTIALIPSKFRPDQVLKIVDIFRTHAPYIPTLVTMKRGEPPQPHLGHAPIRWLATPADCNPKSQLDVLFHNDQGWPIHKLPVEIYERIASGIDREDLMNCRLVNREFEKNFSGAFYQVAVVPFGAQIYIMMMPHSKDDGKGKGKAKATPNEDKDLGAQYGNYLNLTDKDLYDGMKVFRAYGAHIRKFAMTFEVDEDIMRNPPTKGRFETFMTFWGEYVWPCADYTRYKSCEYLERKADETCLMESALSHLTHVNELALSVDSGLGWIAGPDRSNRAEIFRKKPKIFGSRFPPSSSESQARDKKWTELTARVQMNTVYPRNPIVLIQSTPITSHQFPPLIFGGVDYETLPRDETIRRHRDEDSDTETTNPFMGGALIPNDLTTAQKEWLLETRWAQEAFLTSWYLALVNNAATFRNVHSVTITRLSSGHLAKLQRQDIWTSLKNLKKLTIMVLPDWNEVGTTGTGVSVETSRIEPSMAADVLFNFLEQFIADLENVTTLKIGYVGGGERAQGLYARNKHILRAPIVEFDQPFPTASIEWIKKILKLPHVQHLTLSNCWITPDALKMFVQVMRHANLNSLVLDSVSLTAQPGQDESLLFDSFPVPPVVQRIIKAVRRKYPGSLRGVPRNMYQTYIQRLLVRENDVTFVGFPVTLPEWLEIESREGSWPDIINSITPGQTLDEKRFISGVLEKAPTRPFRGSLSRIEFISCGYVVLPELTGFYQDSLSAPKFNTVPCLDRRVQDLDQVMMAPNDIFLAQMVTFIEFKELITLLKVWGMTHGWSHGDGSKWDTREDGQPKGGSGRFSGSLESL